MIPGCELSIIVASTDAERTITSSLTALRDACAGLDAEILVVDASRDSTAALVRSRFPEVSLLVCPPGALVPSLWEAGWRRARGRRIAFTIAECVVERSWARSLLGAIENGAAGAGGCFALAPDADAVTRAVFYLRYSAFLEGAAGERDNIAGDNACYRREVLERFHEQRSGGFWEVEVHSKLRAAGERLVVVEGAVTRLRQVPSFRRMAAARFRHGRRFGAWRVHTEGRAAWKLVVAAPLLPAVLTARIARRVLRNWAHVWGMLSALPVFLPLATCWAIGEALGAAAASAGRPREATA